ncbi:multicopper oxidase domain-containing protein [Crocinitomicaceae bacterium]|nr:multicopper oxidase domain-containing protein [Crocinitomicaceae bacterium]
MRSLLIVFLCSLVWSNCSLSATIDERLVILRDSLTLSDGGKIPYITFNDNGAFSSTNSRIELDVSDQLDLWVVNFDTVIHEFAIKGVTANFSIPVGDSVFTSNVFSDAGAFIFYDPLNFPDNAYLGLSGMIAVKDHQHASFYWNIKEHKDSWNSFLTSGLPVDWSDYYPNYFTINGRSAPNINSDTDSRVVGSVGDTLMIYVTNTGQSIHPLHFHGYHIEVMYSSKFPTHVGRSKDSEGVYPFEGSVFRLIPDQPGEYPVHDHNLVATTGGNIYPLGMFLTMLINP